MEEMCSNCRFWDIDFAMPANQLDPECGNDGDVARCQRFPPRPFDRGSQSNAEHYCQPLSFAGDWCGEYQPRKPLPTLTGTRAEESSP